MHNPPRFLTLATRYCTLEAEVSRSSRSSKLSSLFFLLILCGLFAQWYQAQNSLLFEGLSSYEESPEGSRS